MILNPWDVQSKRIHTTDGIVSTLNSGERRWGGGDEYILVEGEERDISEQDSPTDGKQSSGQLLRTGRIQRYVDNGETECGA